MLSDLFAELKAPNGHSFVQPLGLYIDNEWVHASGTEKIVAINPADENPIVSVHSASAEDVDRAVKSARAAFRGPWKKTSGTDRGALLHRLADLVEKNRHTLATIETWSNGKPYTAAYADDLAEVLNVLRYYAGYADKTFGKVIETRRSQLVYTLTQPVGVCAGICPWNYPLSTAAYKLAPAIAAGNTMILKAAEQTPLSILVFADLFKEAGFPPGVLNVINGTGRVAGASLAAHLGVDKVSFTGSTLTGREIMKAAVGNLKNITLETGGKSPMVIFEDADLDSAAYWGHIGIMSNQGQVCTANSRILVHESIYDRFVELFKEKVRTTSKIGDPFKDDTFQGPQVTKAQFERVLSYVESGRKEGATLSMGGKPYKNANGKGFFMEPTIFTEVTPNMKIYQEEVFGPFVVIASFRTEEEAVEAANNSSYGLAAAVFTKDVSRAHRLARDLEAGTVWINSSNNADIRVPFGGVKASGIGYECGPNGIAAFLIEKSVFVSLL